MSQSNLLNCVDIQVYKDPKFKSTLETAILSSPQTITLPNDEKFKNVTDDLNSLIDGNCVIVSMPGIGILYGQLIIEDSKYKIRYLDSPTDNSVSETIEHPPNANQLPMINVFSEYNRMYNENKSIEDIENYFKSKKRMDGRGPLYPVVEKNNGTNIIIQAFNDDNINITNKTDTLRIGIVNANSDKKKYEYYYYNIDGKDYMEKIRNITPYVINQRAKIYKNEDISNDVITGDIRSIFKLKASKPASKTAGGRRRYKRKSTKKIKKSKIRKGKKSRRSK